jgi:hypothetical protein
MDTISPVLADAFRLLYTDLYSHLCEADFLASKHEEWSEADIDAARRLIPDLVTVIRGVLIEHEPQPGGNCQTCMALPGRDDSSRAGQGSRSRVRRDPQSSEERGLVLG